MVIQMAEYVDGMASSMLELRVEPELQIIFSNSVELLGSASVLA